MIIKSLTSAIDQYKLPMSQLAWKLHPTANVEFTLINRTKSVRPADLIPEGLLRDELDHARSLSFNGKELDFIADQDYIKPGYVDFLRGLRLPEYDLEIRDGQFILRTRGPWPTVTFWETVQLRVVQHLLSVTWLERDGRGREVPTEDGMRRLRDKVGALRCLAPDARIIEFGTRRAFSYTWQAMVLGRLKYDIPEMLLGTSNLGLARIYDVPAKGTNAHEMDMCYACIFGDTDEGLLGSHRRFLDDWYAMYGEPLSIALTDTFGTEFFFRDFTPEQASKWRGVRQDSGDPIAFGERVIAFYQGLGIDPATKAVVFSDGLDVQTIIRLQERFRGRVQTVYGWGTNLTNDVGCPTLSLVCKVTRANGKPAVKLSDNLAKAVGPKDEIERYKRVFGYSSSFSEKCVY